MHHNPTDGARAPRPSRRTKTLLAAPLTLAAALLVTACGGGGGGGVPPTSNSQVTVTFPSTGSITDATQLIVRGDTSGTDPVVGVSVQGVTATSTNSFATWQAPVALNPGRNTVTIVITDQNGRTRTETAAFEIDQVGAVLVDPQRLAIEPFRNSYLVLDERQQVLLRADQSTGTITLLSGLARGNGPDLRQPTCLAYDVGGDRIFVGDSSRSAIIQIDPVTGDRSELLQGSTIPAPLTNILTRPRELVFDGDNQRLIVSDAGSDTVYAVSVPGAAVTLISGGNSASTNRRRGSGPSLFNVSGMVRDAAGNRMVLIDSQSDSVVAVNLITGDRTTLSNNTTPSQPNGPDFQTCEGIALDPTGRFAFTANVDTPGMPTNSILQVDLITGARTRLSGPGVGMGTDLLLPQFCTLDIDNRRLLVGDANLGGVIAIDLDTGARSRAIGREVGGGPRVMSPGGSAVDTARNRMLVTDTTARSLVAVDLRTGVRSTLATFDNQAAPLDITVDTMRDRALVTDRNQGRIFAVQLATGALTELNFDQQSNTRNIAYDPNRDLALITQAISNNGEAFQIFAIELGNPDPVSGRLLTRRLSRSTSPATGSGTGFFDIVDLIVDPDNDLLIALDRRSGGTVLGVDLDTGNRSDLASTNRGSGPQLTSLVDLALDQNPSRVLVLQDGGEELIAVTLSTGNREVVSRADTGSGPRFGNALSVASTGARALLFDSDLGVLSVDGLTGNRVITSSR